jgi:hypothetical protein
MTNKTLIDHLDVLNGDLVRPSTKEKVAFSTLESLDAVVLYFVGPWCRCGKPRKDELTHICQKINCGDEKRAEFIFAQWRGVRPDSRSIPESTWDEYMADMPWLTLNTAQSSSVYSFKSSFAPTFVVLCLRDGLVTARGSRRYGDLAPGPWRRCIPVYVRPRGRDLGLLRFVHERGMQPRSNVFLR